MNHFRTAAALALSLACVAGTASMAAPAEAVETAAGARPLPYAPEDTRPVQPGDILTVTLRAGEVANGLAIRSEAFLAEGTLRMNAPRLTATVAVKCDASPGTYPVELGTGGSLFTNVRVEKADAAALRECRTRLKDLPPTPKEEHWDKGTPWPQNAWDVRQVPAGGRIVASDSTAADGAVTLNSPAFTGKPVLRGGKNVLTATATIACDTEPGLYAVYQDDRNDPRPEARRTVWARYRVVPGTGDCGSVGHTLAADSSPAPVASWALGGTVLAAGIGALLLVGRRSRTQ
ncbi:hypothetical protein OG883_26090 [Streptomyces sp. NBC_01142]|uniref:hypothetical protein n=1 Tax=Streptomyces sp. NBC_01142 TaxID=2975865 RepID=UPI002258D0FB|nr:hypothetical protein [Streptomyces sp. NBC_01142]MCX4823294.1 hypothetical protein [Streptomyces sp. NBC_01142]